MRTCKKTPKLILLQVTTRHNEQRLLNSTYSDGPASICLDASTWQYYDQGVMKADQCPSFTRVNHCVQLVGYNVSGSEKFWTLRNSWDEDWGEQGYIRLEYGSNACGVTNEATTATITL